MNKLKFYRCSAGMSQPKLGAALGITRQAINAAEHRHITLDFAKKVADVIDVNPFTIMHTDCFVNVPETKEDLLAVKAIIDELLAKAGK